MNGSGSVSQLKQSLPQQATASSTQMKKSVTSQHVDDENQILTGKFSTNQSLTKSVDYLLSNNTSIDDKKHKLVKQIDLQSQKDINSILAANSRQMTLSKSIKDVRMFVSNSYSPSQIVRPPMNPSVVEPSTPTPSQKSSILTANSSNERKESRERVLDELNPNNMHNGSKRQPTAAPRPASTLPVGQKLQTQKVNLNIANYENISTKSFQKEKPIIHTNLKTYTNTMMMPLKDEKSDQVRIEYMQQQQMISRLQKQQLREKLLQKEQEQKQQQLLQQQQQQQQQQVAKPAVDVKNTQVVHNAAKPSSMPPPPAKGQRDDDELINCILEMKPLNKQQQQHRVISQHVEQRSEIISNGKQTNTTTVLVEETNRQPVKAQPIVDSRFRQVGVFFSFNF